MTPPVVPGASTVPPVPAYTSGTAPGALPVLGHAPRLLRDAFGFLESLPAHGDLVRIKIGPVYAYTICHPGLLWEVLANDHVFDKGGLLFDRLREIMGNGVATCPHAEHRDQRQMIQPAFSKQRIAGYSAFMEQEIAALTKPWKEGGIVDGFPTFCGFALQVATRALFATSVDDEAVTEIRQSFGQALSTMIVRIVMPNALRRLPIRTNRHFWKANARLATTVNAIVSQHRHSPPAEHPNILSTLLAARADDGAGLTEGQIRDQVVTLLGAAAETTAATLAWACYLLTQHPEAERQLHNEVDSVLNGRSAHWDDLADLPYSARIITETLRMYPPVWFFTRTVNKPVELADTTLPAGTTVVISPYLLHHHAGFFDNPGFFDPDRWLPERAAALPRGAFTPFGHGARRCIGDRFGMAEATLALATMASRWRWETAPGTDLRPQRAAILYPRRLLLQLQSRAGTTKENTP